MASAFAARDSISQRNRANQPTLQSIATYKRPFTPLAKNEKAAIRNRTRIPNVMSDEDIFIPYLAV
jgi:hypothetical protein